MTKKEIPEGKQHKSDGIVTKEVIESVAKKISSDDQEITFYTLKNMEPLLFEEVIRYANKAKDYFRHKGLLSGAALDKIADVAANGFILGALTYQTGIGKYDAKKLSELYNRDYDEYLDKLIDMGLSQKAKIEEAKEEPPKAVPGESSEPGNPNS